MDPSVLRAPVRAIRSIVRSWTCPSCRSLQHKHSRVFSSASIRTNSKEPDSSPKDETLGSIRSKASNREPPVFRSCRDVIDELLAGSSVPKATKPVNGHTRSFAECLESSDLDLHDLGRETNLPKTPARTRFAPSPTGYLHIGGLRTALFSYLLAKRTRGQFLLRIEDTDQKRLVADAESKLISDLQWAGIQWDEGPGIGGPHGPYRQSERTRIYQEYAQQLLDQGSAYRCFCKPQNAGGFQMNYVTSGCYQSCSSLPSSESQYRADYGRESFTVRLRPPADAHKRIYEDLIYGKIQRLKRSSASPLKSSEDGSTDLDIGADTILLKSDGTPTYHFANVIDDHLMQITHVIRGSEWAASTPLHYDIYSAFGWTPPKFAHVGLLVDKNKAKLSKRNQDLALDVASMRDEHGVLPETLCNFLALLGWSNPRSNDVMNMDTLVRNFDLKFTKGNTMVHMEKLWFLQKQHVARLCAEAARNNPVQDILPILSQINEDVLRLYPEAIVNGVITSTEQRERTRMEIDSIERNPSINPSKRVEKRSLSNDTRKDMDQRHLKWVEKRLGDRDRLVEWQKDVEGSATFESIAYSADVLYADSKNFRTAQQFVERNRYFFHFDPSQVPAEREYYNKEGNITAETMWRCAQRLIQDFDDWGFVGRASTWTISDSLSVYDGRRSMEIWRLKERRGHDDPNKHPPLPRAIDRLEKRLHNAIAFQTWLMALDPELFTPVADPPETLPKSLDTTLVSRAPRAVIHNMIKFSDVRYAMGVPYDRVDWTEALAKPGSIFPYNEQSSSAALDSTGDIAKELWDDKITEAEMEGLHTRYKVFRGAFHTFLRQKLAYGLPGPSVSMVMAILGKEECQRRLKR